MQVHICPMSLKTMMLFVSRPPAGWRDGGKQWKGSGTEEEKEEEEWEKAGRGVDATCSQHTCTFGNKCAGAVGRGYVGERVLRRKSSDCVQEILTSRGKKDEA